jgi:hypothetical protein
MGYRAGLTISWLFVEMMFVRDEEDSSSFKAKRVREVHVPVAGLAREMIDAPHQTPGAPHCLMSSARFGD